MLDSNSIETTNSEAGQNPGHDKNISRWWKLASLAAVCLLIPDNINYENCQSALLRLDYLQAKTLCEKKYRTTGNKEALMAWIDAQGELGELGEIEFIIPSISDEILRADAMMRAAYYVWQSGNSQQGLHYYASSAAIYKQAHMAREQAFAFHSLFYFTWVKSDYRQALSFASQSLAAAEQADDPGAELTALTDMFIVFQETGHLDAARHVISIIEDRLEQGHVTQHHVDTWINKALLDLRGEHYGLALHTLDKALAATESGVWERTTLRALHLNLVHVNLKLGRIKKAEAHLESAWRHANPDESLLAGLLFYQAMLHIEKTELPQAKAVLVEALNRPDLAAVWAWEMHYYAGKVAEAMGDEASATASYEASIASLESQRESLAFDDMKTHLLQKKRNAFEALFLVHVRNGRLNAALEVSERAKARSFLDAFIRNSEPSSPQQEQAVDANLEVVADHLDSLRGYMKSLLNSHVADLHPVGTILEKLHSVKFLSYFVAQGRLFIIALSHGRVRILESGLSAAEMEDLFFRYRQNPNDLETLAHLGEALVPGGVRPTAGSHIYISTDDFVGEIALASIRVEGQFLAARNTLSLVPSANAWLMLTEKIARPTLAAGALVLGDPAADLPAARHEASEVALILDGTLLLGAEASVAALREIGAIKSLHIATHSGIAHLGPWLQLAEGKIAGNELVELLPQADFIALASCASGVGAGAGLWGSLGGLLLSRGTPEVLVTLWSVSDAEAQQWMQFFYRAYASGLDPAYAVAQAQRQAIQAGIAPNTWGAFTLLGGTNY